MDGAALSLTNPGPLLARLLGSLELPDGRGSARPSRGLAVLLQEAGAQLRGSVPDRLEEFAFFLRRWEAWQSDEEAVELLEAFLSGELSAARAQEEFRTRLHAPDLKVPPLRMNSGRSEDRAHARCEQLSRLLLLAEICGAQGALVIIDELDHDHGGRYWIQSKVLTGLAMFQETARAAPLVTMLLATPGIQEIKTPDARTVQLSRLDPKDLEQLVRRTVDLYRRVYPGWPHGGGFDRFFRNLWLLYEKRFEKLGWGPRFFVRAAIEACELSAEAEIQLGDVNL